MIRDMVRTSERERPGAEHELTGAIDWLLC